MCAYLCNTAGHRLPIGQGRMQVHVHDEDTLTINVSVERHEPEKDDPEAKYIRGVGPMPVAMPENISRQSKIRCKCVHGYCTLGAAAPLGPAWRQMLDAQLPVCVSCSKALRAFRYLSEPRVRMLSAGLGKRSPG